MKGYLKEWPERRITALKGRTPKVLQQVFCAGALVPFNKEGHGLRPVVVGGLLRELGRLAMPLLTDDRRLDVGVAGLGPTVLAITLCKTLDQNIDYVQRPACLEGIPDGPK